MKVRIIDVYQNAYEYISNRQNELKKFIIDEVLPDGVLKKLWLFTFSHNPLDPDYPINDKIKSLSTVQVSDIEYLFDKINNCDDKSYYEFLSLMLFPLYFALDIKHNFPKINFIEAHEFLSQELLILNESSKGPPVTCRISNAWPDCLVAHKVWDNREDLCIEFDSDFNLDILTSINNYSFILFQKRRLDSRHEDLFWGEGIKEYFITLCYGRKRETFPAPIFNKCIDLIKIMLKKQEIRNSIIDTEMETGTSKMEKDNYVLMNSMRRRFLDAAIKFKAKGSFLSYFKDVLKHNDEFKKASFFREGKRKLKHKYEHSGGTIESNGKVTDSSYNEDEKEYTKTPEGLVNAQWDQVEIGISIKQIIDLLDNPKEKEALQLLSQGYSQQEISSQTGLNQSTISRLPEKLKKLSK